MDSESIWQIAGIILCIALSGFFSASETAFTTVSHIRLKSLAQNGNAKAGKTLSLAQNYDQLLSTILIGNNIVNIVAASMATLLFTKLLQESLGVPVSTAVITIAVLIFGEVSPKSIAKENAESFAMAVTPVLRVLTFLLTPLNFLFSQWKKLLNRIFKKENTAKVTPAELMTIVDEAQNDGELDDNSGELIRSAIEFDDLDVADILTPRVDVVAVSIGASMSEVAAIFSQNSFSRLPVFEDTIDDIVGMVHEKDFFCGLQNGISSLDSIIKKVSYISPSMKISDLLRLFQQSKTHIAVVVDEFGGTEGIVTMEDVLEELVGDIWDEHDVVIDYFERVSENSYLVDCSADLDDFFERFGLTSAYQYDCVTVGGWVMEQLGKIPAQGDSFSYSNVKVTVTEVKAHHAEQIQIEFIKQTGKNE